MSAPINFPFYFVVDCSSKSLFSINLDDLELFLPIRVCCFVLKKQSSDADAAEHDYINMSSGE